MPTPDDAFFEAWEADLTEAERAKFWRDGVIDPDAYAEAPIKLLYVMPVPDDMGASEPHPELGRDLRAIVADPDRPPGNHGTAIARWTSLILEGELPTRFGQAAAKKQLKRVAVITAQKIGGPASEVRDATALWGRVHGERLLDQIDAIDPQVIILCGDHVHEAWPAILTDQPGIPPVVRGEYDWEGKSVLATVHPAAPGMKTEDKNADAVAFADSPEIRELRGDPPPGEEPEPTENPNDAIAGPASDPGSSVVG